MSQQVALNSGAYLSVTDAAKVLSCCRESVLRRLRRGHLPGVRMAGMGSPWRVPVDSLREFFTVRRNATFRDGLVAERPELADRPDIALKELDRIATDIARVLGPAPVVAVLNEHGARGLSDLHREHYGAVKTGLLRLIPREPAGGV